MTEVIDVLFFQSVERRKIMIYIDVEVPFKDRTKDAIKRLDAYNDAFKSNIDRFGEDMINNKYVK